MIAVIQRIKHASISVNEQLISECGNGLVIFLGVAEGDTENDAVILADKISKLRVFTDDNGKMNLSIIDVKGESMIISNFTLLASYRNGNRPDYMKAAKPEHAEYLYDYFSDYMNSKITKVAKGCFGEHMIVNVVNDGPITIHMDTNVLKGPKQ